VIAQRGVSRDAAPGFAASGYEPFNVQVTIRRAAKR